MVLRDKGFVAYLFLINVESIEAVWGRWGGIVKLFFFQHFGNITINLFCTVSLVILVEIHSYVFYLFHTDSSITFKYFHQSLTLVSALVLSFICLLYCITWASRLILSSHFRPPSVCLPTQDAFCADWPHEVTHMCDLLG